MGNKFIYAIRRSIGMCIEIFRSNDFLDLIYIYIENIKHRKHLIWMNNESIASYCKLYNEKIVEIEPERKRLVFVPAYFELQGEKTLLCDSPAVYVAFLSDVTIIGGAGGVIAKDYLLLDDLKNDKEGRLLFRYGPVKRTEHNRALVAVDSEKKEIEKAINLCGFAATNYYHFTMEILSRLDYLNRFEETIDWPILIDSDIRKYSQFVELLNILKGNHEIIYVDLNQQVNVNRMAQISMNTWMPMNVKKREMFRLSDNVIAESGIENIRKHAERFMKPQTDRKIYLSRKNTKLSRIRNEEKIIPYFEKAGFEIVYTEKMSYVEQIELFSSAKCIVGATGAAFTNLIYCRHNTVVGCLIPEEYNFAIYSTIAHYVGAKVLFLDVEIVSRHTYMAGDLCKADLKQCERYIEALLELCG